MNCSHTPRALLCVRTLPAQELAVLHCEPKSAPLLPAHAVIADHGRQQQLLLVRGTSTWADCLTDFVAHTQLLGTGALDTDATLLPPSPYQLKIYERSMI